MSDKVQRDEALAAEYALGTLRGSARLRFQRRLQAEPALAAQVARWQTLLAGLDQVQPPVTPPETLWKKIVLSLPAETRTAPKRRTLPWLAAACVALGLALSAYWLREPAMTPLAVLTDAQHSGQWVVSANRQQDVISLAPLQARAVRADQSLELWLIPPGESPVSLGLISGTASQHYPIEKSQSLAKATLAISLEPHGGSPTGRPTGPVLYSVNL
ncbi:anti-sigma factor [Pantoea dispersa]|uniref:anti-sigma factor n=2 Tax=Pantoea dispersa TaxID=59814 RepID=UPI0013315A60|nr:anti-sigma factor [Pantoea dispersa]KAF0854084.1 hypothetical protein Y788_15220 [Pantoea dispersa 625]MDI6632920.1 anti-sigma factor [Pantoea dispersa]MDI9765839.1 anti-sigma factor [Pantoea dispersa]